jgi:trimethylamine---corrinoid protein Co-methyltransferase
VAGGHSIDMRSLLCSFGSPNQALIGIGVAQMARHYGLRSGSNSGLSDSLSPDFQAGVEKGLTAVFSLLAGTAEMGCQGIVGADQGFSFEQLVLDNEWISMYNYVAKGIEVSEEAIAFDLMKSVGIGGNFISEDHTVEHLRECYWPSDIFARSPWGGEEPSGDSKALERAHDFVLSALRDGEDEYAASAAQAEDLGRILAAAERNRR